ncbi:MAG: NUDIX hydrolase [Porticoccus sp.]|nr:NUDIX hydrolase [Porticoccus sp.]
MSDKIHLTVATVVTREDLFLMVREIRNDLGAAFDGTADQGKGNEVYNQPAGHVEPGETPIQAVVRETFEETGWHVEPTGIISFTTYTSPTNHITYYRLTFAAKTLEFDETAEIDSDIEEALWLSYEEILLKRSQLRSPVVLQVIDDFRANSIYSLDLLKVHR